MRRWRRTPALGLRACASPSGRTGRLRKYTMCVTYTNKTTTTAASSSSWAIGGARRAAAAPARGPRRLEMNQASRGRPSRRAGRGGAGRARVLGRRRRTACAGGCHACFIDERCGVFAPMRVDERLMTPLHPPIPRNARQGLCGAVAARCTDAPAAWFCALLRPQLPPCTAVHRAMLVSITLAPLGAWNEAGDA